MHDDRGIYTPVSASRRIIMDLMHEARQVPSIPVQRTINLKDLDSIRRLTDPRISWFAIFMKAFAVVAEDYPQLRRSLIRYPWTRFYDHPISICSVAIERQFENEPCLFFAHFRAPEKQTLVEIQDSLKRYKELPILSLGMYRRALSIGRLPTLLRRILWWSSLNFSGIKRAKRMGTFGITSYGVLGAESLHPISPLTCTFNFGPISPDGTVSIKIIYDHRTLDGSEVARRLKNIEEVLMTLVRDELLHLASYSSGPKTTSSPDLINASTRQDLSHEIFNPNHDLTLKPASQKTNRLSFETD
ncbi:MAG: hypothetical protein WCJ40_06775 [Planctomycetota bacterium]